MILVIIIALVPLLVLSSEHYYTYSPEDRKNFSIDIDTVDKNVSQGWKSQFDNWIRYTIDLGISCDKDSDSSQDTWIKFSGKSVKDQTEQEFTVFVNPGGEDGKEIPVCKGYRYRYRSQYILTDWKVEMRTKDDGDPIKIVGVFVYDNATAKFYFHGDELPQNNAWFNIPLIGELKKRGKTNYRIWIHTADKHAAGTDNLVWIKFCNANYKDDDKKDDTNCVEQFLTNTSGHNLFEKNYIDGFFIKARRSIGTLHKAYLKNKPENALSSLPFQNWAVNKIAINDDTGKTYYEFGGWEDRWQGTNGKWNSFTRTRKKSYDPFILKFPFCNINHCGTVSCPDANVVEGEARWACS